MLAPCFAIEHKLDLVPGYLYELSYTIGGLLLLVLEGVENG